ncbi:VOC family protein [Microlunatus sp. Y2014]|uniref:VOC family protein n=1 Tax=Microlunatus sp. Y2014 TaxID=3418488 RepID=UPI003DA76042
MKLEFLFIPTSDLEATLALYRDTFGCTELWREGDSTAALSVPGTDMQLMLDSNDPDAKPGPIFVVDSVTAFHDQHSQKFEVLAPPAEIPGGFMASYAEPGGGTIQVLDQSTDSAAG